MGSGTSLPIPPRGKVLLFAEKQSLDSLLFSVQQNQDVRFFLLQDQVSAGQCDSHLAKTLLSLLGRNCLGTKQYVLGVSRLVFYLQGSVLVTIPGFVPVIDLQRYNLIYVHKGDKYKKGCVLKPVVVTFIVLPLNSHVQMFRRDFLACTFFCFFLLSHFWSFCTHLHIYRYSTLNTS